MTVLKRHENNKNSNFKKLLKYTYNFFHLRDILFLIITSLVTSIVIFFILGHFNNLIYFFLLTIILFSIFQIIVHLSIISSRKEYIEFEKLIKNKYRKDKEVLIIIAKDNFKIRERNLSPSIDAHVKNLIRYLDLRWGKNNYSILYTKSFSKIIDAIKRKKFKHLYFYGHGTRSEFENFGRSFPYEALKFIDDKKESVIQLTCCEDEYEKCAADYILENRKIKKYQAGITINTKNGDLINFYIKDLVENKICKDKNEALNRINK